MINIATNIYNKLSHSHKEEIGSDTTILFGLKELLSVKEYREKDTETKDQEKFYLGEIPIEKIINDIVLWDSFTELISKIIKFTQMDSVGSADLQFWIASIPVPIPVNIFFSIKKSESLSEIFPSLRDTLLISKVFETSNITPGKILIVGYDKEGKAWRINYI